MRNLVAHHDDKDDHDVVWLSITRRVPELIAMLRLTYGVNASVIPTHLTDDPSPGAAPFPGASR